MVSRKMPLSLMQFGMMPDILALMYLLQIYAYHTPMYMCVIMCLRCLYIFLELSRSALENKNVTFSQ